MRCVSFQICAPAFTGKLLYLYGSYSGRTSSHFDFSKYGNAERPARTFVKTANFETPIAG